MKLIPLSAIDLFKIREVLEESSNYLRSNNLPNAEDYTNQLFLEKVPGTPKFYTLEVKGEVIGFTKISDQFPLPGFLHIRLLIIKEKHCAKRYGSQLVENLKKISKSTLWIDITKEELSLPFWQKLGFKEEAGRWVLN
ncbi:MAG: hypothetical protein ACJAT2_000502 [Bacteriovoracaceae bacterium]|jgi:hypothetical protein